MRELSDNDLRWFGARLSIAVEDTKRFGGMSVHDMKQALRDVPGAENLTLSYAPGGNLLVTIAGRTVEVSPAASNAEIELAFREPAMSTPNVTVTPLPVVAYASAPTKQGKPMTTTPAPGSFVAGIRAMMDEAKSGLAQARTDGLAKVGEAVAKLGEAKVAVTQVSNSLAKTIEDEAASVMSELGQFSNFPPE